MSLLNKLSQKIAPPKEVELTDKEKQGFRSFTDTFEDTGVQVPNVVSILLRRSGTQVGVFVGCAFFAVQLAVALLWLVKAL